MGLGRKGISGWEIGKDMEGAWSVQQINLYRTCKYISFDVFSPFFVADILKFTIELPTNCWQILN